MNTSILSWPMTLLCSSLLLFMATEGKSSLVIEDEDEILSPCVLPSGSHTESASELKPGFFNEDTFEFDERDRETILMLERKGDGRAPVKDTREFPYSAQVYFRAKFSEDEKTCEVGSGTFIAENVILTAGHVVYSHKKGGLYKSLDCFPAAYVDSYRKMQMPFGSPKVKGVKVAQLYRENKKNQSHDYALVFLDSPTGRMTGYLGLLPLEDEKFTDELVVTVAGYPADKMDKSPEKPSPYWMDGHIVDVNPEELGHTVDTFKGQSGSGLWCKGVKGGYYLIGVHAYGNEEKASSFNYGPRLTRDRGQDMLGWIKAFKQNTLVFDH